MGASGTTISALHRLLKLQPVSDAPKRAIRVDKTAL